MRSLNKVQLIGNLGKDPEIQRFESGAVKAAFSLATSESYMGKDGVRRDLTEWHNIVMWRGLAEIAEKYLRKGKPVFLEGRIRTRSWDDQATGAKKYMTEIECTNLIMLGGRDNQNSGDGLGAPVQKYTAGSKSAPPPINNNSNATSSADVSTADDEVDDLPF